MAIPATTTSESLGISEPGIRRNHWKGYLLAGVLLAAALAGGLWRQSSRLNDTERKLVGVWESRDYRFASTPAVILLPDRREFLAHRPKVDWICDSEPVEKWKATPNLMALSFHMPAPTNWSLDEWMLHVKMLWRGRNRVASDIVHLTDNAFTITDAYIGPRTYDRSTDPELLTLFDRLSARESP